eukprot:CAMPEP_0197518560 /NCGR_PEP_ID=MMETSP1318-20131121/3775_1 /TAXON_ID=552666 /ORGANISM="Partenskyella glossopodia, Strain RCC365" /LENGTH=382 /DNA_ID=CAMNT_0043068999 /DNA_START=206 /DNA_END=1351 /DNA_ORIENTATION=-
MPSALRRSEEKQKALQSNISTLAPFSVDEKQHDFDEKIHAKAAIKPKERDENISMAQAAQMLSQATMESEEEPDTTPTAPVNEATFKVTLKTGAEAAAAAALEEHESVVPVTFSSERSSDAVSSSTDGYTFSALSEAKFQGFHDKEVLGLLGKWGVSFAVSRFRFHESFDEEKKDAFLLDLFSSKAFQGSACRSTRKGHRAPLQRVEGKIHKVHSEELNVSVMNMGFFDRIQESGIVTPSGKIRGCFEDIIEGITINNLLRKCLVDEDDENFEIFDEGDRNELIFNLFSHIVIGGGSLNQYEDMIEPYIDTCKKLYKDLVSVCKNKTTGKMELKTFAYNVQKLDGVALFPIEEHERNICLICVDTLRRYVTYYYSAWPGESW